MCLELVHPAFLTTLVVLVCNHVEDQVSTSINNEFHDLIYEITYCSILHLLIIDILKYFKSQNILTRN